MNLAAIVDAAISGQRTTYADIREKTLRYMVRHLFAEIPKENIVRLVQEPLHTRSMSFCQVHQIDKYLVNRMDRRTGCCNRIKQVLARNCCFFVGKFTGNYITACYLCIKVLYMMNAFGKNLF